MDDLVSSGAGGALAEEVILVVVDDEVAAEDAVWHLARADLLRWCGFLLGEVAESHGDWVRGAVVDFGLVDLEGLGQNAAFYLDGVFGVLLDVVQEETLDAALLDDHLLETGEAWDGIGDSV